MNLLKKFENDRKYQYGLTISLLVILLIIIQISEIGWADVNHYWNNINAIWEEHKMPYSETMFEYPPLALIIFAIPRLLSWDITSFRIFYAVFAGICYIVAMHYSFKIAKVLGTSDIRIAYIFAFMVICMNTLILARYDVFPVTMILVAIWAYLDKKYTVAFAIIAVATMIKLYPALVAIAFLYPFLARRDWKSIVKQILLCAIICIAVEVPFIIYDSASAFDWVSYHSDRGIQVESVIGSVFEVINYAVPGLVTVVHNFGSENLTGELVDAVGKQMNKVLFVALAAYICAMAYSAMKNKNEEKIQVINGLYCAPILILVFIVFNKVYSAQYLLWAIGLASIFLSGINGKEQNWKLYRLTMTTIALSFIALMAYSIVEGFDLTFAPPFEFLKNIATIAMLVMITALFWNQSREKSSENPVQEYQIGE